MLAYASSAPRSTAPVAPARAPVEPVRSNTERAQQLGVARPACEREGGLWEALGDLGAVVLDALPLQLAVSKALPHRDQPWVRAWFAEQAVADLAALGADAIGAMLDAVIPVGTSVTVEGEGEAEFELLGLGGASRTCVARTAHGWAVDARGVVSAGVSSGVGGMLTGARGAALVGALAEAGVGGELDVSAGWDVPTAVIAADVAAALRSALASGKVGSLPPSLTRVARRAAASTVPARMAVHVACKAEGVAAMAGGTRANVEADGSARATVGFEDGAAFTEVSFGGALGADALLLLPWELLTGELDGLRQLAGELPGEVCLRVQAPSRQVGRWTYALTFGAGESRETRVYALARDVMAALRPLANVGRRLSGTERSGGRAPVASVPSFVNVRRAVEVEVEPRAAEGLLARAGARGAGMLPSFGPVIGVEEAHAEAEVSVSAATALAALRAAGNLSAPTEEQLLDAARAVIAHVLGRTYVPAVHVNAPAVAVSAEVEAEVVTERVIAAGLGASGDAVIASAHGQLNEEIVVAQRHTVADRAEIRALFRA